MMEKVIVLGTNIFRTSLNYRFIKVFFKYEKTSRWIYLVCIVGCFLTYFFNVQFASVKVNILSNILFLFILARMYTRKVSKCIFVSLVIYITNMACDGFVYIVFTHYVIGGDVEEFYGVITVLFIMVIEKLAEKIIESEGEFNIPRVHWFILGLVPLISVAIIYLVITNILSVNNRKIIAVIVFGMLMNNLIIFYIYNSLMELYRSQLNKKILEKQIESYENQLKLYDESQKKYNSLKHDLKHHIMMVRGLLKDNNTNSQILGYFQDMEINYENSHEYINCGNIEIDRIFNYMLEGKKEKLKEVKVSVKIPNDIEYKLYDLNIVLCNILDNAIEASLNSAEKILIVDMHMEKTMIYISVKNSYQNKIIQSRDKFFTTKENGSGIGLENVKKVVERNKGIININYTDNLFVVEIMFYIKLEKVKKTR